MTRRSQEKLRAQYARDDRVIKVVLACLVAALMFSLGFFARGNTDLLNRLGFDTGRDADAVNPGMTVSGSTYDSLAARMAEVQGILETQSFDEFELETATEQVFSTLTDVVQDPTLRYYDAERYAAYLKDVSGSFAGVGVLFAEYQNHAYAVDVFAGSEAEGKGVQPGDFVVAIDGDRGNNDGWTQAEVVKAVSRDAGDTVVITWRRPATLEAEGGQEYTVTLECAELSKANVTTSLKSQTVGLIRVSQITQNSDDLVQDAIKSLTAQGASSFVLDLRDNPGGFLTQSVDIASMFIKSGVVVEIQAKGGLSTRTATATTLTDSPLVVLVNGSTAGTAEVIAGALQDNGRATIVGQRTMGKGTVQSVQELSFGGAIRYTSAYYKTPNGYEIDGNGINPDIQVVRSEDGQADNQLSLAIETALDLSGDRVEAKSSESSEAQAEADKAAIEEGQAESSSEN